MVAGGQAYHVEYGLGEVAVELGQAVGEFGHVDGDELVGVLYTVVKSRDAVKGEIGEVFVVNMLRESCSIVERQLCLMI